MAYKVLIEGTEQVIIGTDPGSRVRVSEQDKRIVPSNTVYCLGTLYRVQGGFVPEQVFVFEALTETDLATLRSAVDYFFRTSLDTDLYVKEVPQDSSLYPEEALRLYGRVEEIFDGAVNIIRGSRAK